MFAINFTELAGLHKNLDILFSKDERPKVVATNGCFDLLHIGHVRYLKQARAMGDMLIVGVNSDESVNALKGPGRPIVPCEERMEMLASLSCVSFVVKFDGVRCPDFLQAARPDVYVKAGDYSLETLHPSEREVLEALRTRIEFVPLVSGHSTSDLASKAALAQGCRR